LESRICNCLDLGPEYETEHAVNQARVAALCTREFLKEVLDERGEPAVRVVLKLSERVFRFSRKAQRRRRLMAKFQIDPLDALIDDERLPETFRARRLPQMREILDRSHRALTKAG